MISSAEDTKKFDNINRVVNETKEILSRLSNSLNGFNMNFIQPNLSMDMGDLSKIANSIQNVNDNSSKIEINNEFNITNKEQVQADNMPKSIEQLMKANINKYGRRMR